MEHTVYLYNGVIKTTMAQNIEQWITGLAYSTVEPPNNQQTGTSHFALYREPEVVLSSEVNND